MEAPAESPHLPAPQGPAQGKLLKGGQGSERAAVTGQRAFPGSKGPG